MIYVAPPQFTSMDVECRFFATFREAVGERTVDRTFEDGTAVGEVLRTLESEHAGLAGELLDDEGEIRPQLSVMLNGRDVVHEEGTETVIEDGDRLSVFPPVAGGAVATRKKTFRGISGRLARHYLENLGGDADGGDADGGDVTGEDWRASVSAETVGVGPTLELTEVTVTFEGDPDRLDDLIAAFSRKAMRAGG